MSEEGRVEHSTMRQRDLRRLVEITDEMVERARLAYEHAQRWPHKHDDPMREALRAALYWEDKAG